MRSTRRRPTTLAAPPLTPPGIDPDDICTAGSFELGRLGRRHVKRVLVGAAGCSWETWAAHRRDQSAAAGWRTELGAAGLVRGSDRGFMRLCTCLRRHSPRPLDVIPQKEVGTLRRRQAAVRAKQRAGRAARPRRMGWESVFARRSARMRLRVAARRRAQAAQKTSRPALARAPKADYYGGRIT